MLLLCVSLAQGNLSIMIEKRRKKFCSVFLLCSSRKNSKDLGEGFSAIKEAQLLWHLSVIVNITSWVEKDAREGSSGITVSESEEINIEVSGSVVTKFVSEVKCGLLRMRNSSGTSGSAGVEGEAVGEEGSRSSFRTD